MNKFTLCFLCVMTTMSWVVRGQDSLCIESTIFKKIQSDSTGMLPSLQNEPRYVLNPLIETQNIGGLRLKLQPVWSSGMWGEDVLPELYTSETSNQLLRRDSTLTNANYSYGLEDSHRFIVDYGDKLGDSYLNMKLYRVGSISNIENSNNKNLNVLVDLYKPSDRWQLNYGYYRNKLEIGENGGLADSTSIVDAEDVDLFNYIPTKLSSAKNEMKSQGIYFNNTYFLSGYVNQADSTDSIEIFSKYKHGIGIDISANRDEYIYSMSQQDIDSMIYDNNYYNVAQTNDSLGFNKLSYGGGYTLLDSLERRLIELYYVKEEYDWAQLSQSFVTLKGNWYGIGHTSLDAKYILTGLWKDGIQLSVKEKVKLYRSWLLNAKLSYQDMQPGYFFHQYNGNHFRWSNQFKNTKTSSAKVGIYNSKLGVGANGELKAISNYAYMDTSSLPEQANNGLVYLKGEVVHHFQSKHISSYSSLVFQTSNTELIRFPGVSLKNNFNYRFWLGDLQITIGSQLTYFTSYTGMAYNPNLRRLYLQDDFKVGGFPLLDVYGAVKIGGADVFVRYDNVLFETISREVYLYPGYISTPRMFRFGLNWKFKN